MKYDLDLAFRPELSYLAGAILGDGCLGCYVSRGYISKRYNIRFSSIDFDFFDTVCEYFFRINKLGYRLSFHKHNPFSSGRAVSFHTNIYSKELYHFLKDWRLVKSLAEQYPEQFLKGFVDAEGNISKYFGSISITQTRNWRII